MSAWTDNTPVGNPVARNFSGAVTVMLAGTLLVFLRRDIGVRLLLRRHYIVAAGLLIGLSNIEHPFDRDLAWFAISFMLLAFIHHWRHMRRIKRGSPEWHTYDTGRSIIFSFMPLPIPRLPIQLIVEPALCGWFGWWLAGRSNSTFYIGWWLVFASIALFGLENKIRVARREGLFDLGDTVTESMHFAGRAENFTKGAQQAARPASKTSAKRGLRRLWQTWQAGQKASRENREAEQRRRREEAEAQARARQEQEERAQAPWRDPTMGRMTPEQALEILELKSGATAADIRAAYSRLMQKVHPDAGGSTFLAKQINLARDTLLRSQRRAR